MKKYIRPIVIINIIAISFILLYPYFIEKTFISIVYLTDFYKEEKHSHEDILILGDSTVAFGIRPRLIKNALSLALPGSTNVNVLFELKRYLQLNQTPRCVVYSTAYILDHYYTYFLGMHMSSNVYTWDDAKKIYYDSEKANVAPASEMSPFHYFSKIFYLKYLQMTITTQMKIKNLLFPFLPEIKTFRANLAYTARQKGYLRTFGADRRGIIGERHDYLFQPFKVIEFDDYYFDQILKLAAEKNIKFIFVEMPLLDLKLQKVDDFNLAHMNHVKLSLSKYPNFKMLNMKIKTAPGKFNDINHLNTVGATEFTNLIKPTIEKECVN